MATTINAYSVSLAMDASSYITASKLSRSETAALKRDITAARTPAENYENSVNRLSRAFEEGAVDQRVYNRLLDEQKRKLDAANQSTKQHATLTDSLGGKLKALAATYLSMQTVASSIRLAAEAEQTAVQFEVLTGSVQTANQLLADSKKIAAASPLSLVGTQQAYRTLLSFGIAANETTQIIGRLSDVTGGNEDRFKMLTLAYAQASAAGRLQGQDLLQMINAGFNPLQEISRRTGESISDLRKRMEEGGISSQEMAQAFIDATSEGGRFDGMTARLADTMGGRLAQAMSKLQESGIELGKALEPIVTTLTSGFEENNGLLADAVWLVSKFADGIALTLAYTRDLASVTAKVMRGDFLGAALDRGTLPAVNDLLDRLEKRDQERQNALNGAANEDPFASEKLKQDAQLRIELERGVQITKTQADTIRSRIEALKEANAAEKLGYTERATSEAELHQQRMQAVNHEKQLRQQLLALEREIVQLAPASATEAADLAKQASQLKKQMSHDAMRDETRYRRELARIEENAAKLRTQEYKQALDAARQHFAEERKHRQKIRDDIAKTGAGSVFEIGSAEAAKFMADQTNQRIAGMVAIQGPKETDQALIEETKKQTQMQTVEQQKTDRMLAIMERQLEVARQNGFQRIR